MNITRVYYLIFYCDSLNLVMKHKDKKQRLDILQFIIQNAVRAQKH